MSAVPKLVMIIALVMAQSTGLAAINRVPRDYPTIQEAIDAASDGDTVLIANGVYTGLGNKDLTFEGKPLTVMSENGPASCIIDCEGDGRGVSFHSREGVSSILQGLTIRNGIYMCLT